MWYTDDDVYHERILVWRVDEDTWYVLTPDRDLYPECWSGRSDEGPISFKLKDVDFRYFSRVSQPVYRFATYPTDDEFKSHISTALRELGLEGVNPLPWTPSSILDMRGQEANTRTYLEGTLVRRRIVRRDLGRLDVPDPTQDPNACGISSLQAAPDGSLWVSMHDTEDHELGSEVGVPSRQAVRLDEANGVVKGPKGWTLVKLVKIGDLPDMVGSMDAMVRSRQVKRDGTSESAAKAADGEVVEVEADGAEDARTLAVEYDDQGERFRSWRDATRECREYSYPDWPHDGPQTALHLMKYMHKNGGTPKQWLLVWSRHKGIHDNDRVMHEMRALLEAFEYAGTYDQLNLGSLACMETLGRRMQSIVDAYNSGSAASPDWGAARIMSGYQGPEDLVSPTLRSWAAKKGKEEVELAAARAKIRDYKKISTPADEAAAAVSDGNLPAGGVPAKPKRKAKARLAPPAAT